jgi:UDP-glucose 4-epimerase
VPEPDGSAVQRCGANVTSTRTVLVTGATGFLGTHVVRQLLASGTEVVALSLHGGEVEGVRVEAVDLSDRERALRALADVRCDAVVHLAAALPTGGDVLAMQASFDRTVAADSTIAAFCRAHEYGLVYASGSSVYGPMVGDVPVAEERLPAPETLYAAAKYVGDVLCLQLGQEAGVAAASLRISAPYGPGARRPSVVEVFLRAALASADLTLKGSGSRTQDFTFVSDVASAVRHALDVGAAGVFNVGTGEPVSMRRLAELALQAVPESSSRIVASGLADPQEEYRALMDVSKAREELGWTAQVGLLEGLRATAAYLRDAA